MGSPIRFGIGERRQTVYPDQFVLARRMALSAIDHACHRTLLESR
jgi:hypothetical protein